MDTKLVISCLAISTLLIGGCTHQQANKAQAGNGQSGPVSDGQGGGSPGNGFNNGGGSGGNSAGGGAGSGSGSNSAQNGSGGAGSGSVLSGGRGNNNGGGFGAGNTGAGNGSSQSGGRGSGSGSGGGGFGNGQNQGGFGSGSAYGGNTGNGGYTPADLRDPNSILAQRIIYFDYNQSGIRPEYRAILDAHGSLLADFPKLNVRLEGHADERGSREYNVALSERRAFSVRDYLTIKGVGANQTDIVGYGEEVPAVFGQGESSWSKNRRVEIIYAGE